MAITIINIENMPAAELKERQVELAEAVDGDGELAERYIKTLITAKLRDEKLAEQAKTLAALQTGLEAAKRDMLSHKEAGDRLAEQLESAEAKNEGLARDLEESGFVARENLKRRESAYEVVNTAARDSQQIADKQIADLTARCERLKAQATKATAAMSTIQLAALVAVNDIQTAATEVLCFDELEKADKGE